MSSILAVDVGTTSIKAGIVNTKNFEAELTESTKAVVEYPKKHWAEKNPDKLWNSIVEVCKPLAEKVNPDAIVFGAHMAGVVPVDEEGNVA